MTALRRIRIDLAEDELGPQDGSARARQEARLEEERHQLRLPDRLAVEALDRQPLASLVLHVLDERSQGRPQPLLVRLTQRDDRAAAALHEQRGLAAEEDDLGSRDSGSSPSRRLRPGKRSAVGLRRVGRCDHEGLVLLALLRAELPKPLDRAAERELRPAEPLDEVAPPAEPERLERLQLPVDGAVAARNTLGADAVPRDDALPLEQELGERPPIRVRPGRACP